MATLGGHSSERPKKVTKTYQEKYAIIKFSEANPKMKRKELAAKFNVPITTLSDMFLNREKIFRAANSSKKTGKLKRLKMKSFQNTNWSCVEMNISDKINTFDHALNQRDVMVVSNSSDALKIPRKLITRTYQEKYDILKFCEANPGLKTKDIAEKFDMTKKAVLELLSNKDKILEIYHAANNAGLAIGELKRLKSVTFKDVDTALIAWYREQRQEGTEITTGELLLKARSLAREFGETASVTAPWIDRFKRRWGISKRKNRQRRAKQIVSAPEDSTVFTDMLVESPVVVKSEVNCDDNCEQNTCMVTRFLLGNSSQSSDGRECEDFSDSLQLPNMVGHDAVKLEVNCDDGEENLVTTSSLGHSSNSSFEERQIDGRFSPVCDTWQHPNIAEPFSCGEVNVSANHSQLLSDESSVSVRSQNEGIDLRLNEDHFGQNSRQIAIPTIDEAFDAVSVIRRFCLFAADCPEEVLEMSKKFEDFVTKEAERRIKLEYDTNDDQA
jgi:hypothetical protein